MKYLVATDGSDESDRAVEYAAVHAEAVDAELHIGHVLSPESQLIEGELVLPGGDKALEEGERIVERGVRLAEESVDGELSPETDLLTGRPADAIAEHASVIDADAIYLGHRGLSDLRERVVGSVAKSVIDRATVPVTVVR